MQSVRVGAGLPLHLEVGIHVPVGPEEPWALLNMAGVATQPRNLIVPAGITLPLQYQLFLQISEKALINSRGNFEANHNILML